VTSPPKYIYIKKKKFVRKTIPFLVNSNLENFFPFMAISNFEFDKL
jgi:hypothetical protein